MPRLDFLSPSLPFLSDRFFFVRCACPNDTDFHFLVMVGRERVFRHECGTTNAPLRVDYSPGELALGLGRRKVCVSCSRSSRP